MRKADDIRRSPAYHVGFFDAQTGCPIFPDADDAYRAGWEAFYRCKQLLEDAGFKRVGDQFTKTTIIDREASGAPETIQGGEIRP